MCHSVERCKKILGYPPTFKPNTWRRPTGSAHVAHGDSDPDIDALVTTKLTTGQYKHLLTFLQKEASCSSDPPTTNALFASTSCFVAHNTSSWILNSGASDHITYDLTLFHSYTPIRAQDHVITIPDGRKVHVQCIGTVCLSNGVHLRAWKPCWLFTFFSWHGSQL